MAEKEKKRSSWAGMGRGKKRRQERGIFGVCKYLPAYEINSLRLRGLEKSHWFIHCRQKLEKISFSCAFLPITQFPGDTESKPFLRASSDSLTFCWINWHILYQIYLLRLSNQARNDFILNRVLRAPRGLWKLLKSACLPQIPTWLTAYLPGYKMARAF